MYRSYRYRLSPTRAQAATLTQWLALSCGLYNGALQERIVWYRGHKDGPKKSIRLFDQNKQLPAVREECPEYAAVPIAVLRGALDRLNKAYGAFFRRVKAKQSPGFPRFRSTRRYDTIDINDLGSTKLIVAGGKRVSIPLLGKVRFKQHRLLEGTPKSVRIKRDGNRWWISIQCVDVPLRTLPSAGSEVGIDLGITQLVTTSDGDVSDNERTLRDHERGLRIAQRRISRRKKGSNRRRKAVAILRRKHQRVANVRREHAITIARSLVQRYDVIFVEDLNVKGLTRGDLSKSVYDAAWGVHLYWLRTKAEEAARVVHAVNPCGTSIDCSGCGEPVPKERGDRTHSCVACGLVLCRDVNAARNILARGRRARGVATEPRRSE
jgi:putative transposase